MSFLPLTLGVGFQSDAESGGAEPPSKAKIDKILRRDDSTCRFCGFSSSQYQRVIPYEGDYVTACTFCEQVMTLERAGIMGSGVLIWLPEIEQRELNHIVRAIYVARADEESPAASAANRALDALMARRVDAKKHLGTDDPLVLATVMHENLSAKERKAALPKLEGIRLLVLDKHMVHRRGAEVNGFPRMVKFWRSKEGPFAKIPPEQWENLFKKIA